MLLTLFLGENVDRLRLIQLGAAVADADGTVRGAWSFNLKCLGKQKQKSEAKPRQIKIR